MAMLIAWHAINKARRPNSRTFTDAFLIVAPGITIKDRLRVLMPEAPDSIYERLSIVPRDMMDDLKKARIVITNYHAFKRRKIEMAKGTAEVLRGRETQEEFDERFRETDGAMIQRVMAPLMGRRGIIVFNDEAHHCYEHKPDQSEEDLKKTIDRAEEESAAEAKADADENNKAAHLWINGIRTVQRVLDIKAIYDLSATPFFLRGSGYREGDLFGWVVSDFSLMDAIESGIVKVPRVPTRDDVIQTREPIFRHIYRHIRKELSRRGRRSGGEMAASDLPPQLEAAIFALYRDYVETDKAWANAETPPVFIVVCNNTTTSRRQRPKHYAMIVHVETSRSAHAWQHRVTLAILDQMKTAILRRDPVADRLIDAAIADLRRSVEAEGMTVPDRAALVKEIRESFEKGAVATEKVNIDNDVESLLDENAELKLRTPYNVFIGGQILDRGITVPNLVGFYYGRSPKKMQQDTVLQHARMYGARPRADLAVTRLYTTAGNHAALQRIHQFDAALRDAFISGAHDRGVAFILKDVSGRIAPCAPGNTKPQNH